MSSDITQSAFVISNWSSDGMYWLQGDSCEGSCSTTDTFSQLSNMAFYTNGSGVTPSDNSADNDSDDSESPDDASPTVAT